MTHPRSRPECFTLDEHIKNYRVGEQVEIMHYETEVGR